MTTKTEKNADGKKVNKEIYKKVGMRLCIIVVNRVDKVTGTEAIRKLIILFLIGNEDI